MVWQQVRPNEVSNPDVLEALQQIDRAQFVSDDYKSLAYSDTRLPIGCGQFMWTPLEEGRILQALQLKPANTVLEVGTGSGFFTALIAKLSSNVISIEYFAELSGLAGSRLEAAGVQNVVLHCGDASHGWKLADRIDVIVLTASCLEVPEDYLHALKVGGHLVAITGQAPAMQVQRITRSDEWQWQTENLFETVVAPMVHAETKPEFTF
ncbi:MAG: protein-L-isoaspartate O-methyltransferase [Methylophaga sp.]|jgi:protein-L-isoaspartate(D-aspartate) O-methyltransferase|nr:protein-L-isoaspartate O-methyltransferase [Methylophaga sp.]MAY18565.1 protein-L-isoaspartate O-methyltransferase [Methylophaga sp.]HAO25684.1 protein-L-isoaspartate O-methyltransferase [Methylophaga sp.]|tara:strand:- start:4437 stop:5063 length:627 start_codon:yes stop_codon:yes gene_type:complete